MLSITITQVPRDSVPIANWVTLRSRSHQLFSRRYDSTRPTFTNYFELPSRVHMCGVDVFLQCQGTLSSPGRYKYTVAMCTTRLTKNLRPVLVNPFLTHFKITYRPQRRFDDPLHLAYFCDLVIFILRYTVGLLHAMNLHTPGRDARPVQSGELFYQSCPVHYPCMCFVLNVVVCSGFG